MDVNIRLGVIDFFGSPLITRVTKIIRDLDWHVMLKIVVFNRAAESV